MLDVYCIASYRVVLYCESERSLHVIISTVMSIVSLVLLCGRLSWLPVSFLLHVIYTLSYRIVSYRPVDVHMKSMFTI